MNRSKKVNKRILIITGILILGIILLSAAVILYFRQSEERQTDSSAYIDENASDWDSQIDSEEPETGKMLIPGYSSASMKSGETMLKLRVGNPEENSCYLKATVQLEDGTVLFESDLLKPGKGFEEIELNQTLEAGTYQAMVHYQGYSLEENPQELNSMDSAFTLTVTP